MFRTRANSFVTQKRRIFLLSVLLAVNQYFGSIQLSDAEGSLHISYVRAVSGRNKDVKLLEIGGRGLTAIKSLRASNHSDNCGTDSDLHRLEWSDHFILTSLKGKVHRNSWNYLCYQLNDGSWKHLGSVGKFMR